MPVSREPNRAKSVELDRDEIAALTVAYGGEWGVNHTRRLLHLVTLNRAEQDYDSEAVWLAAHLHDWVDTSSGPSQE